MTIFEGHQKNTYCNTTGKNLQAQNSIIIRQKWLSAFNISNASRLIFALLMVLQNKNKHSSSNENLTDSRLQK